MKVLIVGGGGREHALAWKAARSKRVKQVYAAPGNAGTQAEPGVVNVAIAADDIRGLQSFATQHEVELTIIGPEVPLTLGIVDQFVAAGLRCFGPVRAAARLESSKTFGKDFLRRHAISTAAYASFTDQRQALAHLRQAAYPLVVKADGLAAGKGVVIAENQDTAEQAVIDMMSKERFAAAGKRVLVEEFLSGEEVSFIAMVDGRDILPMASSQDHKAAWDGDSGPNTGGMGAYSPAPLVNRELCRRILDQIMLPTVRGMAAEGHPYIGFLYAGLMIDRNGQPKVLEFNCRLGDPEAQPIMLRLQSDLIEHVLAATEGRLAQQQARWDARSALGVVMASAGYPGESTYGHGISGLPGDDRRQAALKVFHAGTALAPAGPDAPSGVLTNGGRVLCVTALGDSIPQAQQRAYATVQQIHWPGSWYRRDIGHRAVAGHDRASIAADTAGQNDA